MKMTRWLLIIALLLVAIPAFAQETDTQDATRPSRVMLEGFQWVHQGTNRCSAAALSIHLSFFEEITLDTYNAFAREELNTWGADASVRIEEMAEAIQARGYGAIVRRAGTIDLMKDLLAGGFPVLVENSYYEGENYYRDWLSHNRVLVGYDDAQGVFFFQDPLLGYPQGDLISYDYDNFDSRWRPFTRDYLVIYDLEDEALVQEILGDNWDAMLNAENALRVSEEEIANGQADAFAYYNQGWAQLQLEQYEAAAASFDQARSIGLPFRYFWYEFAPFEAYLAIERYQDVIDLANVELINAGDTISIEEWYYYAGLAYEGLGNTQRALINYEVAVARNYNFSAAADRIVALQNP
ncbi:MAG: C39 family peptidase [Phototrophicaceae bacterium]